jgi:hypothetical protein
MSIAERSNVHFPNQFSARLPWQGERRKRISLKSLADYVACE